MASLGTKFHNSLGTELHITPHSSEVNPVLMYTVNLLFSPCFILFYLRTVICIVKWYGVIRKSLPLHGYQSEEFGLCMFGCLFS